MDTLPTISTSAQPNIDTPDPESAMEIALSKFDLTKYRGPNAAAGRGTLDRREIVPLDVERDGSSVMPIRVEHRSPRLDPVQAALLEKQAASISESVLFFHRNRAEEEESRNYVGLHRGQGLHARASRKGSDIPRLIGVTSAVAGEGKTTVALHIAMALANNSFKKICLVDLSLGKEVLCDRLGIPSPVHGAIDVLDWEENREADFLPLPLLKMDNFNNLFLLPAGRTPLRAQRTAHSPRMGDLLALTRNWSDIVVVDLPSITSGNVLPISNHLDGLVMVVQSGVTPKGVVTKALDRIGRNRILGMVLNGTESPMPAWLRRRFSGTGT